MGKIYVGSARHDENGKYANGKPGDSLQKSSTNDTVGEVSMQVMYNHSKGWYIIRPKSVEHANKIARLMKLACNNPNIGYDQNNRLAITKYGVETNCKTECDCSSLVRQVVKEATGKDPGNFTTANEASMLQATGLFHSKVAYVSQVRTPICDGDILVTQTKGHTVIVVSGNAREEEKTNAESKYYDRYKGLSSAIDTVFRSIGVPTKYIGSYSNRKPVAVANGINGYTGTESQNLKLVKLAKDGKLKKA